MVSFVARALMCSLILFNSAAFGGLVEKREARNQALMVSIGHGLPGLDKDIKMMTNIVTDDAYKFSTSYLDEEQATVKAIEADLQYYSEKSNQKGTFLFYYTGHGETGVIMPYDEETMKIERIRDAIKRGRDDMGPLSRLVLIFDACKSGSFLDPFHHGFAMGPIYDKIDSQAFTDKIADIFGNETRDKKKYWKKLMVLASTRPEENCLASEDGSLYTIAFRDAFEKIGEKNGTMKEFFDEVIKNTDFSTPTSRFSPETLKQEKLFPDKN